MAKVRFIRPAFILLYGFPGSGKTYFARQLCENMNAAHVSSDRIRSELFDTPKYDKRENEVVTHLMEYMTEEFLKAGISVVFDTNASRVSQRRTLRDMARKFKSQPLIIWLQIDLESSFSRVASRDRRRQDDRFSAPMDRTSFDAVVGQMQNPAQTEDYVVISGKHTYKTQSHMVMKKFYDLGLIDMVNADVKLAKPELVNRIPNPLAGRVDITRRNILIR